jgi:integrase/recombinase XerD
MYEKYLLQLEEAGKIRNLKERSIGCYKNYVSYFLNYMEKVPEELTCQDVRNFLLAKKDDGLKATTLNLYNSAIRFFYRNVLHILWDAVTVAAPCVRLFRKKCGWMPAGRMFWMLPISIWFLRFPIF